jgi:signal transduction histidine kinase
VAGSRRRQHIDLRGSRAEATTELVRAQSERNVDLGFDDHSAARGVEWRNRSCCARMLNNLLDNAIRYTQIGGH